MRAVFAVFAFAAVANVARAEEVDIAKFDPNMSVAGVSVTNGIKWIDGRLLPMEGREQKGT